VLEFGAGAGLPGLLCAGLGASLVVLSDYPDPERIDNLKYNAVEAFKAPGAPKQPEGKIFSQGYIWGKPTEDLLSHLPFGKNGFDLLILSDLIFNHSQHAALLFALQNTMAKPDGTALVFFTPHRPWLYENDMKFFEMAKATGKLKVEKVVEQKMEKAMFEVDKGDENVRKMVYGYKITWIS